MSKPVQDRLTFLEQRTAAIATTPVTLSKLKQSQRMLRWSVVTAQTFNLPKATGKGGKFYIGAGVTATGNKVIRANGATDVIQGVAIVSGATSGVFSSAANTNTITQNGTTQGGIIGSLVELWDYAPGLWIAKVHAVGSGVCVTPFSNT
jgi:hypothetical protein